jgi:hypothetical protein
MALHPTAAEELVTLRTPVARHRRQAAEEPALPEGARAPGRALR